MVSGRVGGKVAVITGAGSGIGRAIALTLADHGAQVIASDVTGMERETAALEPGGRVTPFHCDVTDPRSVEAMVEHAIQAFGKLDIMCNNAGYAAPGALMHEVPIEEWERTFAINVRGVFLGIKYAAPRMMERGGSIINTASIGGIKAIPNYSPYLSSKGAIMQLTRAAALDYGGHQIRVNALCPSAVRTPFMGGMPDEHLESFAQTIPLRRVAEPEDCANVALFLASDEAKYLTGGMYYIDGGAHAS